MDVPGAGWAKRLGTADELPKWYEPYAYVHTGYRIDYSACECAASVAELHNETMNIWTHVLGLLVWWYYSRGLAQKWRIMCAAMPLASSLAHTFHAVGPRVSRWVWRLDTLCIAALLYARAFVEGSLLLACHERMLEAWLVLATVLFVAVATLAVATDKPDWLATLFVVLHFPVVHFRLFDDDPRATNGLVLLCLGSASGVLGFALRALRLPERLTAAWPKLKYAKLRFLFDVFGASHQLWHILTILGPVLCLFGTESLGILPDICSPR